MMIVQQSRVFRSLFQTRSMIKNLHSCFVVSSKNKLELPDLAHMYSVNFFVFLEGENTQNQNRVSPSEEEETN